MNFRSGFLSVVYSLGQITLGLLIHPYGTMQSLVQDKVFIWMSLLPSIILALITLLWRFIFSNFFLGDYLSFVSNILVFFCIYWQLMLFYLLVRFSRAFRDF